MSRLTVVYVKPNEPPSIEKIRNVPTDIEEMIEGCPEEVFNTDGTCIVCNRNSKLMGAKGNRRLDNGTVIAGPFFIVGYDTDKGYRTLTESEVTKYMDRFKSPEKITNEEVEADSGFMIYSSLTPMKRR